LRPSRIAKPDIYKVYLDIVLSYTRASKVYVEPDESKSCQAARVYVSLLPT